MIPTPADLLMDTRELKALELAARARIVWENDAWSVPSQSTGGTYRVVWSAWGPAANFPPCTHSAELIAVDPANGTTSSGHVADLAKLVQVPATGASDERYIANLKPGDYYLDIASECGWQVALSPSG